MPKKNLWEKLLDISETLEKQRNELKDIASDLCLINDDLKLASKVREMVISQTESQETATTETATSAPSSAGRKARKGNVKNEPVNNEDITEKEPPDTNDL